MLNLLRKIFNSDNNNYKIQSFTFFIPSPPARTTGYREKQFDKIFYDFINKGYEILSFNTQASNSQNQSGMWVICVVRAKNKEAEKLMLSEYFHDQMTGNNNSSEIEGLYYIKDLTNEEN